MTSQTIKLNLIPQGIKPMICVSQCDTGQQWLFNLMLNGEAFTIPVGASVTIQGTRPDGATFKDACTYLGNVITATETEQMTAIAGNIPAQIRIEKDEDSIGTLNFIIRVEKKA